MSDLKPKALVLCSSRLAIPALLFLHNTGNLCAVLCCSRDTEFEEELNHYAGQAGFNLTIANKHNWKEKLTSLLEINKPDIVLVKTFPYIINDSFLNVPKHGFINFHYALLPEYRGAFPLFHLLKNQEPYGGISVHRMTSIPDGGPLLFKEYVPISSPETYGSHFTNLANAAVNLTKQLMEIIAYEGSCLKFIDQDETKATLIPKPKSEDLIIKWKVMSASEIVSLILATNYWSKGAITFFGQQTFQILYARVLVEKHQGLESGTVLRISEGEPVAVACNDGFVIAIDTVFTADGYLPGFELKKIGLVSGGIIGR